MIDQKTICASLRHCYGNSGKGCESCPGKNESGNGTCKIGILAAEAIESMRKELNKYHILCSVDEIPEIEEILYGVS